MTIARTRHEVGDQVTRGLGERIRQAFEVILRKSVRAASLFRIYGLVRGTNFNLLFHSQYALQFDGKRKGFPGTQHEVVRSTAPGESRILR